MESAGMHRDRPPNHPLGAPKRQRPGSGALRHSPPTCPLTPTQVSCTSSCVRPAEVAIHSHDHAPGVLTDIIRHLGKHGSKDRLPTIPGLECNVWPTTALREVGLVSRHLDTELAFELSHQALRCYAHVLGPGMTDKRPRRSRKAAGCLETRRVAKGPAGSALSSCEAS